MHQKQSSLSTSGPTDLSLIQVSIFLWPTTTTVSLVWNYFWDLKCYFGLIIDALSAVMNGVKSSGKTRRKYWIILSGMCQYEYGFIDEIKNISLLSI